MMVLGDIFKKLLIGGAFSVEEGRIKLFGRMYWTLFPSHALALNLQSIGEKLGKKFLYKLGCQAGDDAAEEMLKSMGLLPKHGWMTQNAVIELTDFIGFGKMEFIISKLEKNGKHHFVLHIRHNPVIEYAAQLFKSKSLVCYWFMGVYAAHSEAELGLKNAYFKENKCLCKGAPYCEWETTWF